MSVKKSKSQTRREAIVRKTTIEKKINRNEMSDKRTNKPFPPKEMAVLKKELNETLAGDFFVVAIRFTKKGAECRTVAHNAQGRETLMALMECMETITQ